MVLLWIFTACDTHILPSAVIRSAKMIIIFSSSSNSQNSSVSEPVTAAVLCYLRIVGDHDDRSALSDQLLWIFMTSSLFFRSRLPVGSSAIMIWGSLARALAIATLCAPRQRCSGAEVRPVGDIYALKSFMALSRLTPRGTPRSIMGISTFCRTDMGDEVEGWKMKPISSRRILATPVRRPADILPSSKKRPLVAGPGSR